MSNNVNQVGDNEVDDVLNKLWTVNSAPSAHCFAKATVENRTLSDDEIDEIYNCSEGHNDQATEKLIRAMNRSQFDLFKSEVEEEYAEREPDEDEEDEDSEEESEE
jgi:hypothetical protein